MKVSAKMVLLAGALALIATIPLLAPSGAVAKVAKAKRPDVRIVSVWTYPYTVLGVGRSDRVRVQVEVTNRGRAATTLTYRFTVTPLLGNLPGLPGEATSVVAEAIKPGEQRLDLFNIKNLPIGRYTLRVEAVTVGEVKKGDNVGYEDAFCVIPEVWRGTASLRAKQLGTGADVQSDTVPSVTFTFKGKESTGFVYTAAGQVTETISGGAPVAFAGTGTFDIVPDQSTLILSPDMLVYDILGLPPQGATFSLTGTDDGGSYTHDSPFAVWLHTGPRDRLPEETTLAGTYPFQNEGMTGDFTWNLSAATE
jgi:hypothetical protein